MEKIKPAYYVFQTDSEIVKLVYEKQDNYLIEFNKEGDKKLCAIYFCSNDIYYPNTEDTFRKRIIQKNYFEWYHTRINKAYKHIFIRDIFKQWYLAGINKDINTPNKLIEFIKKETKEYKVITVGSSAGGYAAILYGSFINTTYSLVFNPQFEIKSLLEKSSEEKNPLLFRMKNERFDYFDITPYINKKIKIFYFNSNQSPWDTEQSNYVKSINNVIQIFFKSKHHGIPFLKVALPIVLNLNEHDLENLSRNKHNPIFFTIKMVGLIKTCIGFYKQIISVYKKRK